MSWLIQLKKIKDVVLFEAKALFEKLDENETALMTILWNTILRKFNTTSKSLQSIDSTLYYSQRCYL